MKKRGNNDGVTVLVNIGRDAEEKNKTISDKTICPPPETICNRPAFV